MNTKITRLEYCGIKDNVDDATTYAEISANCRSAMRDALRVGDLSAYAYASIGLAESSRRDGNAKQAESSHVLSLRIFTELSDRTGLGRVYWSIGNLRRQESRYSEALVSLNKAYRISKACDDQLCALYSLSGIAETTRILGSYRTSLVQHKRCLVLYNRISDHRGIVWALEGIAQIYKNMGRYADSLRLFCQANKISQLTGDYRGVGYAVKGIGECQMAIKPQSESGISSILTSCLIFENLKFRIGHGYAKKSLGDSYVIAGNIPKALETYKEARDIFLGIKNLRGLAYVFLGLAEISFLSGDLQYGIYYSMIARSYFNAKSLRYGLWKSNVLLAKWVPLSCMSQIAEKETSDFLSLSYLLDKI